MWFCSNRALARVASCVLMLFVADAGAQTFPSSGWLALTQGSAVLADPFDNTFASSAIDLVGDKNNPGALLASDAGYVYFRVRVAGNPVSPITHHYYGYLWSCLLDFDQDPQTYELLTGLDAIGSTKTVDLDQNTSTGTPDDIGDPAETQLVSYDAAINSQSAPSSSTLGGGT